MKIDVNNMIDLAYRNLNSAKDGYEAGMLAAVIAIAEELREAQQPSVSRKDLENKPEMKPAASPETKETPAQKNEANFQNANPQSEKSQKVANIMSEAAKKVSSRIQKMHEDTKAAAPKKAPVPAPAESAPVSAPAETPKAKEPDDAYYDSDEWRNKHLDSSELDATWTPRMKKNILITNTARKLQQFIGWCKAGNMPQGWIDNAISNVSNKRYTSADDKNIYSPQMVQFILSGLQGEYEKSQQNQAA